MQVIRMEGPGAELEAAPAQIELVEVPAGEVNLGSRDQTVQAFLRSYGEVWSDFFLRETPQHSLHVPAFRLAKTCVTNHQYQAFIEAGGYADRRWWTPAGWQWREQLGRCQPDYWGEARFRGDDRPVVGIAWHEAYAFARWAGGRLPTEAEWERAAKADGNHLYPWGSQWDAERLNTAARGVCERPLCTTPVGSFSPQGDGPFGHQDLLGQVWEWTSSQYRSYPYHPGLRPGDLSAREDPYETAPRVVRGGNWSDGRYVARNSHRSYFPQDYTDINTGFRIAADLNSPQPLQPAAMGAPAAGVELLVFGRSAFCPDMVRAKEFLYRLGVPYRQLNIDQDRRAVQALESLIGMRSVPTLALVRPGELYPVEMPRPLPPGQQPRNFDRGTLVQEPEEETLLTWIDRFSLK